MPVYIHITAKSPFFETTEIVCQSKAVERLEAIRANFLWFKSKSKFQDLHPDATLSVTTGVHNPEIPFKY